MAALEWQNFVRRAVFPYLGPPSARQTAFGVTLGILISYNACLTLGFGLFGSKGNSVITGLLLFGLPLLLFLFSYRGGLRFQLADFLFAGLLITALLFLIINANGFREGLTSEYALLAATFAGYAACRPIDAESLVKVRSAFERVTAIIVLLGALFTAEQLFDQWDGPPGKPLVFGFNAAGTYFTAGLGFLILALVTVDRPRPVRTLLIVALIFLPTAIFAAAMVRFAFLALAGSLLIAAILTEAGKRWHIAVVALALFLAAAVGLGARYSSTKVYAAYILEETVEIKDRAAARARAQALGRITEQAADMPSCSLQVNTSNSIAIRRALVKDALYLIPTAGFLGLGLDSFMEYSCILAHEVHVSILQAAVEFGWLGCACLVLLVGVAAYRLFPLAKRGGAFRFVFCSLVFAVLLSMAHGRISRDSALFALLGCAVGAVSNSKRSVSEGLSLAVQQVHAR